MALFTRERTGIGQEVKASLLGSLLWLQYTRLMVAAAKGQEARPGARNKPVNPLANVYQAGDGKWLCMHMGAISLKMWPSLCKILEIEELVNDPRFCGLAEREEHSEELVKIMDERFRSRPASEWAKLAREAGIVLCPVNALLELCDDPQVLANEYVKEFPHPVVGSIKAPGYPVKLSETPLQARYPAPQLGQHTEEVLMKIGGYTQDEINQLKYDEVI
jgi:formyl-CoA transferase